MVLPCRFPFHDVSLLYLFPFRNFRKSTVSINHNIDIVVYVCTTVCLCFCGNVSTEVRSIFFKRLQITSFGGIKYQFAAFHLPSGRLKTTERSIFSSFSQKTVPWKSRKVQTRKFNLSDSSIFENPNELIQVSNTLGIAGKTSLSTPNSASFCKIKFIN